ncbi:MAG TPA: hypothetical protein VFS23_38710 [Vicinamibacterales bacterium]|nr:hypothetical protein [Vicinamibacterales bacterium]
MTWLLRLYPARWRRRYGEEFLALIAPQRFSFVTVLDIIGGAIDAWTQPQSHLAARAAQSEGDTTMLAKMMRLRCAGYGAKATTYDGLKGAGVMLGGTLLSVLVARWMQRQSVDPVYTQTLMSSGWLIAFVVSMPYTTLKGWPGRTQAIFISALLMLVVFLALGGAWISRW